MTPLLAIGFVLKDGAAHAGFSWIGAVVTVLSLTTFVAWMAYALFSKRSSMEAAANLPFDEIDGGAE